MTVAKSSRSLDRRSGSLFFWLAVICFALGLMAKPMLVTLPFVMLLLDYWPLRRFPDDNSRTGQSSMLKFRFKPQSGVPDGGKMAVLRAHRGGFVRRHFPGTTPRLGRSLRWPTVPLISRLENVPVAYVEYLLKTDLAEHLWPSFIRSSPPIRAGLATAVIALAAISVAGLASAPVLSVWARGLALVFGNAGAGDRPGAGWRRGDGRSLHLFSVHRYLSGGDAGRSRAGETVPDFQTES